MEMVNAPQNMYDPSFEHDNCGIGAITNIYGKKSHDVVADALKIVENLEHRAGKDAEGKTSLHSPQSSHLSFLRRSLQNRSARLPHPKH